ncbi:putative ATP-dependent RNA helicase [Habropoda laboriosa]|uniref:ATP-dependent RNA helicase n=1 Tax=Habropoda laboriosa TaxID=597456 RepID=A0A0L7R5L7_9HYME|nr:PREDICTED: probable ATP-dependent RNA helicase DDX31 [Habropoda laboriosa]KOC66056.1 putative ATP-dependent RNA helicase [Habropoda laboriosa]
MTVQDMDISLNISAKPGDGKSTERGDDFLLNLMREKKTLSTKPKIISSSIIKNATVENSNTSNTTNKRVKQKSLATIVAQRLKGSNTHSLKQSPIVQKKLKTKSQSVNTERKESKQEVVKASIKVDKNAAKSNRSLSNRNDEVSNEPVISFAKVTKDNFGKTLFAKKRNITDANSKKTLSSIFSKQETSENKQVSLLNSLKRVEQEEDVPEKKSQLEEFKKLKFEASKESSTTTEKLNLGRKKKRKDETENNSNVEDNKNTHISHKSGGKISSLFGHNPDIPNIGQRLVKPINEPVFTGTTFADLNVHPFMISNLEQNMNITKMTTVQQKAIPQILSGKDILIRSQTGSGKTLAYALPIVECLHKIRPKLNRNSGLNALVVVPTRELALQTYECFLKLIKPFTWIVPGYLAGGEKRKAEKARLRKGCNILVGTPGRLLDHIKRTKALKLNDVKCFVLDEADRMFDMGYEKDISGIVSALKVSTPSKNNTEYDAMKLFRQNKKKIFTDDDIERLENSSDLKESEKNDQGDPIAKSNKSTDSDSMYDTNEDSAMQKREYHSSSDNDSDEGEPFVKSEKFNKRKVSKAESTKTKESNVLKDNTEQKEYDNSSRDPSRKQTILLSATLTQAVEKLAGLAMDRPVFVDAAKENLESVGGDADDVNEDLVVPQSVTQSYIVTPPKLRMVTLSAYITGKCQSHGQHKVLVFMATQDMVDYHTEILSAVLTKPIDEDDEESDPLVDVEFFKLHGSMTQKERTEVFKTFRLAKSGVLLCTDVAARGLDLPKVDCVIQYTGPTSARDYVHRIGRTARAGSSGSATIFLTPPEIEFVRMLESRRIRIKQENMEDVLDKLLSHLSNHSSPHNAAIALQNDFENMVLEDSQLRHKAYKAYTSWIRFYSSYPRDMKEIFNRKEAHLGHYAKSFALRETPQKIGGAGKKIYQREISRQPQHNNKLTNERPDGEPAMKKKKQEHQQHQQQQRQSDVTRMGLLKRVRMLNTSEYGSGLEPVKKPKKS